MATYQCFWLEPTTTVRRFLRRYSEAPEDHDLWAVMESRQDDGTIKELRHWPKTHTCADGWHEARNEIQPLQGVAIRTSYDQPLDPREEAAFKDLHPRNDPRWPKVCAKGCGYVFEDRDHWQVFTEEVYRRIDRPAGSSDAETTLSSAPFGAMWDAWWFPEGWKNAADGICLTVKLPDGTDWPVDGPSSSCAERKTTPEGTYIGHDNRTGHRCWTRTGDPKAIPPTVDVTPSIASGHPETYHGYLRNGQLVD